jgi:hypothetical protein
VQQQGEPPAAGGLRPVGDVERVGLQAPEQLALAVRRRAALAVEVDALLGLVVAGEDAVHHAGAWDVGVVLGAVEQAAEVDHGRERRHVPAVGERLALRLVAPPGWVAGLLLAALRLDLRDGLLPGGGVVRVRGLGAEGDVEERGRRRERPAAAGRRRRRLLRRDEIAT